MMHSAFSMVPSFVRYSLYGSLSCSNPVLSGLSPARAGGGDAGGGDEEAVGQRLAVRTPFQPNEILAVTGSSFHISTCIDQ